jgi:hypothetical protein
VWVLHAIFFELLIHPKFRQGAGFGGFGLQYPCEASARDTEGGEFWNLPSINHTLTQGIQVARPTHLAPQSQELPPLQGVRFLVIHLFFRL